MIFYIIIYHGIICFNQITSIYLLYTSISCNGKARNFVVPVGVPVAGPNGPT